MKLFLTTIILVLLFSVTVQGQESESPPDTDNSQQELLSLYTSNINSIDLYTSNPYTFQQNRNKTTAWILLGSGVTLMVGATIWGSSDEQGSFGFTENFDAQTTMFIIGGVASLASIPFFISAGKHKKRVVTSLKWKKSDNSYFSRDIPDYPAISITIPF